MIDFKFLAAFRHQRPGLFLHIVDPSHLRGGRFIADTLDGLLDIRRQAVPFLLVHHAETGRPGKGLIKGIIDNLDIWPGNLVFDLKYEEANSTYYLACIWFAESSSVNYSDGDNVSVIGVFSYYEFSGHWQIVIEDETDIMKEP